MQPFPEKLRDERTIPQTIYIAKKMFEFGDLVGYSNYLSKIRLANEAKTFVSQTLEPNLQSSESSIEESLLLPYPGKSKESELTLDLEPYFDEKLIRKDSVLAALFDNYSKLNPRAKKYSKIF